jgi:hypothetical protein
MRRPRIRGQQTLMWPSQVELSGHRSARFLYALLRQAPLAIR